MSLRCFNGGPQGWLRLALGAVIEYYCETIDLRGCVDEALDSRLDRRYWQRQDCGG